MKFPETLQAGEPEHRGPALLEFNRIDLKHQRLGNYPSIAR